MIVVALVIALLALAAVAVWLRNELTRAQETSDRRLAERNADVDRRLHSMTETMDRRLGELDTKVDRRMASANETSTKIHEGLAKTNAAMTQMNERARDLGELRDALRPPKARGGFGELLLANLLADTFPADKYSLQHGFSSGERVDAVIRLGEALVPVDSKFPLDNYQRLVAAESDADRDAAAKLFARDVKGHVDAIATKYIRPDEGTYEFALMYLPAEAVYYELVCNRLGGVADPVAYAYEKRVFPVSPSTLHAYLMVVVLGFKGLQIEEHAREVMSYVADLNRDFDKFKTDFDLVGRHLGNAQTKFADADKRLSRFETKLERAAESELVEGDVQAELAVEAEPAETVLELPRALDAA
jgi:DNA recombination protein RmuC